MIFCGIKFHKSVYSFNISPGITLTIFTPEFAIFLSNKNHFCARVIFSFLRIITSLDKVHIGVS